MNKPDLKPIPWVGTSLQDLRELPEVAQSKIGRALQQVQYGSKPTSARVLSGFHGASVLEIRVDYDSDTYRAVYTVRFAPCGLPNRFMAFMYSRKSPGSAYKPQSRTLTLYRLA